MSRPVCWSFEDAFHHATGGLALVGLDGRWLELNDAACDLLGRGHLVGRSLFGACELEDALALLRRIAAVVDEGLQSFAQELRVPRLDGSHSWLRLACSAIPDADGAPAYLAVALADVTEHREARAERDAFFDLCPDPLVIATQEGYVVRANASWEATLGWSTADMRAAPFLDFVHPDDRERTAAEAVRLRDGQATPRFRNRYRARAGGYRWLEWQARLGEDGRIYAISRDVTEQQQAMLIFDAEMQRRRQRLDEAEQRLDVHVNNTPLAVVEFDARLRVRRWSPRAEALFGWAEEEVIGDRPDQWRFIHEDDADAVATAMLSLVSGEAPSQVLRNRNHTRDGAVVHCEWFYSAVFDDDGALLSLLAFAQDVTARVQAEAESAEREALFRATFEQAPVGIAHVDLDGRWLRVNQTLCDFLGHSVEDMLALSFRGLSHPDEIDADVALMTQVLDGRIERYERRKRYLHRDGRARWAQITVSLRRDDAGRPLHFISVIEDIAAAVEAEQAIRRANDELELRVTERTRELESANRTLAVEVEQRREAEGALRESEVRMRAILENSHDAFIAMDEAGCIVEWNRSAEAIFGWRRAEAVGRPLNGFIVPGRFHDLHGVDMATRYLAGGGSRVLDQRLQLPARHRNGHEFPVEITVNMVRLGGRHLFTAFLHDISERVAAERQLRESEARLRTITDNVPAMIASVGPDLRYRFANGAYCEWFGRDGEDIAGLHLREVLGEDGYAFVAEHLARAKRGEQAGFDRVHVDADGGERHSHVTYIPDPTHAVDGACGFFVAAHDVTTHKHIAQAMERRALRDDLTGLPNRAAWMQALEAAMADDAPAAAAAAAVMFLDLDR
ncbi:MAG TPA: PAS domain S-box protein, partial [Lysobacter sp.]|nr:PAS domain S-box protein [Lysobacter sp.]